MELKPYQQKVLDDLEKYLEYIQQYKQVDIAFNKYWEDKIGPYNPVSDEGMRPYQKNISNAGQICIKVPTAGGKTFIACNTLNTIFNAYEYGRPKTVVWLVPWSNLLSQTKESLSNPDHPYRLKLNTLFNNRVAVYDKDDLLHGANFNPTIVNEQLSIFVLSFASLRINRLKKEDRKIYQENSYIAGFKDLYKNKNHILKDTDETALINVIRWLNPLVIVDESHNAESELSIEMLKNLNPSFIFDLTATPKENSNIISFVNAMELKKEHMVKLPVIVYNHHDKNEVITSALQLQRRLEKNAIEQEKNGGMYIRPVVLFQAQPKTGGDKTTFEKIKEKLLELNIPEEQIKIKTANINELKDIDLLSKDCNVRYIITINALKEGWDCPFAYILASLADKSSVIDVEQILGRILRQPYVRRHKSPLLNLSYVLTSSSKFHDTLKSIVSTLQNSGFSDKDYRQKNIVEQENLEDPLEQLTFDDLKEKDTKEEVKNDEIDTTKVSFDPSEENNDNISEHTQEIEKIAIEQSEEEEKQIKENQDKEEPLHPDLVNKVKFYKIKEDYNELASSVTLPQFYINIQKNEIFGTEKGEALLNRDALLENFKLSNQDINIDFENVSSDLYKVDLEKTTKDTYIAALSKIDEKNIKEPLIKYILARPKDTQVKELTHRMMGMMGKMYPIPDQEIKKYIKRILDSMESEQIRDFIDREYTYRDKIKMKIRQLSNEYAEKQFKKFLDTDKIFTKSDFKFPSKIIPGNISASISKSLYEKEGKMNSFEEKVILEISNMSNIAFWHRNLERGKGFYINAFMNHYPDFIVLTKSERIVIIETKGDDRDNSDSEAKNRMGRDWANKAGSNYKYFMVFDNKKVEDTLTLDELKDRLKEL